MQPQTTPPAPGLPGAGRRLLVVEDDAELARSVRRYLALEGFVVEMVREGDTAERLLVHQPMRFDAVVLDLLLPGLGGRELCRRLREAGRTVPVLVTTALGDVDDRVAGLRDGADDYLVKPFSLEELTLRITAVLRRGTPAPERLLEVGDLRLDLMTHRAWRGDVPLGLTQREFRLLELFLRRPGLVLSRDRILSTIWGTDGSVRPNVIDQYVAHLRRKIDRPFGRADIETLHRVGYRLRAPERA